MQVSRNELEVRYARAFEAMGFPAGLAGDAAWMVIWYDVWGLGGLNRLSGRLDRLDGLSLTGFALQGAETDRVLDAAGASLLAAGPEALDLLEMTWHRHGHARVRVTGAADGDLAAGLAGLAKDRRLGVAVYAALGETALVAQTDIDRVRLTWGPPGTDAPARRDIVLEAGSEGDAAARWLSATSDVLAPEILAAREMAALDDGIPVDAEAWRRIYALGARFLVPETAASRTGGAGGGNDND